MSPSIHQTEVRTRARQGFVGQRSSDDGRVRTLINQDPQAKKVVTMAITRVDDFVYVYEIDMHPITATETVEADDDAMAATLAAAHNADPVAYGNAVASAPGGGLLQLTAHWPGFDFDITESSANIAAPVEVTPATGANPVPFGVAILDKGPGTGGFALSPTGTQSNGVKAISTALAKQADVWTVPYVALAEYVVQILGDHMPIEVHVVADTNQATTITAIKTALDALIATLPVPVYAITAGATELTVTAEYEGQDFETAIGSDDAGASIPAVTFDSGGATSLTSLAKAFAGISLRTATEQIATIDGENAEYAANAGVEVLESGRVFVARPDGETVVKGGRVYVGLDSSEAGLMFAAAAANRVALAASRAQWEADGSDTSDGVALLRLFAA